MEPLQELLESARLAKAQTCANLALFPVLAPPQAGPQWLVMAQALEQELVTITEVNDSGSVPELLLQNRAGRPVLAIEGEELVGAKQNRVVNTTILAPAGEELVIPVSCVEEGRWAYRGQGFASQRRVMSPSLRAEHSRHLREGLAGGRGYASDQAGIWDGLRAKAGRMDAASETGAMADLFQRHQSPLQEYAAAFRAVDCQVGAVLAVNGHIAGLECFGSADTLAAYLPGLVQSYALDALDWREQHCGRKASAREAEGLLGAVRAARRNAYPSPGLGRSLRLDAGGLAGAALVWEGRVVHLSALRLAGDGAGFKAGGVQRFSRRRVH
jgi:hypothetical protein